MKSKVWIIFFLFLLNGAFAQKENGRFFLETGIKVAGGEDNLNFMGKTGFSYNKTNWESIYEDGRVLSKGGYNNFSWAIAPRLGYSLTPLLMTGIDFQYFQNKYDTGDKYLNFTSGMFLRYHFLKKRISPFAELGAGLGRLKEAMNNVSPGGAHYEIVNRQKLHYFAGSAGVAFNLTGNFLLNLSGKIQNTIEKEILNNSEFSHSYSRSRNSNWEISPVLSFAYIFNKKKKKNNASI